MAPPPNAAILHNREAALNQDTVRDLQARIQGMQRTTLDTRAIPTHPALTALLPGGALMAGGVYVVDDSTSLGLALLQGPSAAGSWCAIVGMPDVGIEAVAGMGIDLERLVLVPYPGDDLVVVLSALIDVVTVVLVRHGQRRLMGDAVANRLAARLRQREAVLVSVGEWPRHEARLRVASSDWAGIGAGFGYLSARRITVDSTSDRWNGRTRSRRLVLSADGLADQAGAVPLAARSHLVSAV